MLRSATLLVFAAGWLSIAAFRADFPATIPRPAAVNSTVAPWEWTEPAAFVASVDPNAALHILMLNYSAYDSAYARKVRRFVQQQLPASTITEFWDGTSGELATALSTTDAVLVVYPSNGQSATLRAYGKALSQYVRGGGAVLFTGTNEYSVLQQYGLLDLDYGYFCDDLDIHAVQPEHPVFNGTPETLHLTNFAYPLDVSDAGFVSLAEIRGYPVLGYKPLGAGKVIYLGLEYYYNEPDATRLLANAICWAVPSRSEPAVEPAEPVVASLPAAAESWSARAVRRTEEVLFTGSGAKPGGPAIDLKIYPNPYFSKATLDLELPKAGPVAVEMTDETGRIVSVLLPQRTLAAGSYRFELPNLPTGVYLVHCNVNGQATVKKVVKTEAQ
jgi:hypothetical protein